MLSPQEFRTLKRILGRTDEEYRSVANRLRCTRPGNVARHRASMLRLSVNVDKAKACPQKDVSHNPLPTLVTSPRRSRCSPTSSGHPRQAHCKADLSQVSHNIAPRAHQLHHCRGLDRAIPAHSPYLDVHPFAAAHAFSSPSLLSTATDDWWCDFRDASSNSGG
jgi:hypothetical protein